MRKGFPMKKMFFILSMISGVLLSGCAGGKNAVTAGAVKSGYVPVDGGRLYYEEMGAGTPVVLVHGHSLDRRMWDGQWPAFARRHRVIRYDVRGYGRSSQQSETLQFTHVGDLLTLMDSLHLERAHIVGLSMGGFITADMLGVSPQRMLSAVMANGNIRMSPGPSEPVVPQEEAVRDSTVAAVRAEGIEVYKKRWFEGLLRSAGTRAETIREPLWQMIADWDGWQALHKEVRVFVGRDAWRALETNRPEVPVLLLTGQEDGAKAVKAPRIMKCLPNARWEVVKETGHMMNMERPETFNAIVLQFLEEIDSGLLLRRHRDAAE